MSAEIVALQRELKTSGAYRGDIDGEFGPLTLAAAIESAGAPSYMLVAAGEMGVSELYGRRDNPRIRAYHAATTIGEQPDEIPWCSSFLNWVMLRAGERATRNPMARSWLGWGQAVPPAKPEVGLVAVLERGKPPSGHVGLLVHWSADRLWLLGGNQGDRVCVSSFPKSSLLGLRKPAGRARP